LYTAELSFVVCRNIDDVDKTMDEINEQTENMKQIQEALSTPIGAAADIDEVFALSPACSSPKAFHCVS
jgi:UDP-N-acetylmuramoylalanine-D-glutamate ligase